MSTQLALSALEEELLYVLYDDYLLRHALLSVESVSVSFDNAQNRLFPQAFSLVLNTNKDQPLILENNAVEGFIQTFQTYKRMEMEREEWVFLEQLLGELKEEMPRYMLLMEEIIQKRTEEWFASRAFLPERMDFSFREETAWVVWNEGDLSTLWSRAWQRFAAQKKNYFTYMGFTKTQLMQLESLQVLMIEEIQREDVTEVKSTLLLDGQKHTFSFYPELSHLYVDGTLAIEDDQVGGFSVVSTGQLVGEFFEIEKTKGYDFEKTWQSFLGEEPALYAKSVIRFAEQTKQNWLKAIEDTTGLCVTESYLENDAHVIVLEDGRKFKEWH